MQQQQPPCIKQYHAQTSSTGIPPYHPQVGEEEEMETKKEKQYDVYVAYCDKDLDFARRIIDNIERKELTCYFKDRDEESGYILENLCKESLRSRSVLIICTENSLKDCLIKYLMISSLQFMLHFDQLSLMLLLDGVEMNKLPKEARFVPHVFTHEKDYLNIIMDKLQAPKISFDNLLPVGNISSGLVWSYFYGYLNFILPEIPEKIKEWISKNPTKSKIIPKRIYLLLPTYGNCYDALSDTDEKIEFVETFKTKEKDQAGNRNRFYGNSVYKISKKEKEYYFVGEYATPIKTMFEMEKGQIAGLTKSDLMDQINLFKGKLSEILAHKECLNSCCTLLICDNKQSLSDLIVTQIEKDLQIMK